MILNHTYTISAMSVLDVHMRGRGVRPKSKTSSTTLPSEAIWSLLMYVDSELKGWDVSYCTDRIHHLCPQ